MASIVWAPRALDDIDALILYISRDSAIRARRFASRMISRIDSLASQPESGSWLPKDDGRQYRQIFHGTDRVGHHLGPTVRGAEAGDALFLPVAQVEASEIAVSTPDGRGCQTPVNDDRFRWHGLPE